MRARMVTEREEAGAALFYAGLGIITGAAVCGAAGTVWLVVGLGMAAAVLGIWLRG